MKYDELYRFGSETRLSAECDLPERQSRLAVLASLNTHDIFRELIATELRDGRLTASRRRRIVRYAAHLGLSAVETGQLIARCRDEALQSDNPHERAHALRLVEPEPARIPKILWVAIAVIVFAALNALALNWWGA